MPRRPHIKTRPQFLNLLVFNLVLPQTLCWLHCKVPNASFCEYFSKIVIVCGGDCLLWQSSPPMSEGSRHFLQSLCFGCELYGSVVTVRLLLKIIKISFIGDYFLIRKDNLISTYQKIKNKKSSLFTSTWSFYSGWLDSVEVLFISSSSFS